jgi:hypothetical protein
MALDGRGFYDQTGGDQPASGETSYILNCFVPHDPSRINPGFDGIMTGSTSDANTWVVENCVSPGISQRSGSVSTLTRADNILSKGTAVDPSELEASPIDLFYDPAAKNFATFPGSALLTKAGADISAALTTIEAWVPDMDLLRDITNAVWDPADPGVGPYGKAWPVQSDTTAPVLSAFDDGTPGPHGSTCSVTTNEIGGTLYWVRLADGAATPSAAQVVAGQDSTGASAGESGNQAVTAVGAQSFAMTGTTATTYKIVAVHKDRHGNLSNVLTGSVTLAAEYSPAWQSFTGGTPGTITSGNMKLRKTAGSAPVLTGAQASTKAMLAAYTIKQSADQLASSLNNGIVYSLPSASDIDWDTTSTPTVSWKQKSAVDNATIVNKNFPTMSADVEYLCLMSFTSDAGGYIGRARLIRISDGAVIGTITDATGADNSVRWSTPTTIELFNNAASYERFMLWDNATADAGDSAVQQLFVKSGGGLEDPAVAIASIGTPLISLVSGALLTGVNAGSGGDFTLVS